MIERFFTPGHKIKRPTNGSDNYGGNKPVYNNHLNVDGKLFYTGGNTKEAGDKDTIFSTHKFITFIADIKGDDLYVDPDGNEYEIKGHPAIRTRPDGKGHIELDLELIS